MRERLEGWYRSKHPSYQLSNQPNNSSKAMLSQLIQEILLPLESKLGEVTITYGFTSHPLLRYILQNSPGDMAPEIDQHAAMELNSRGNRICKRDGASCDFYIRGYENKMDKVAKFICTNLQFDRLYFYGKDKPIHISVGPESTRFALIRKRRSDGVRVNSKSAKGSATRTLFDDL
ncbi:hypothetical protein [Vibrio panuliri]|nr:hypothetical protein [Vibrio panuliri]KAB1454805.1 hypothetical protein F7O85_18300 [Vibrio panuliri]